MKTMTYEEFEELLEEGEWTFELEYHEAFEREAFDGGGYIEVIGSAVKTSKHGEITIHIIENYMYDKYNSENRRNSDSLYIDPCNEKYIDGVTIVDDEGFEFSADELFDGELFEEHDEFVTIHYGEFKKRINSEQIDYIDEDVDENSEEYDTFIISVDHAPKIRFTGEMIASAESTDNSCCYNYSGDTGLWSELAVYRTIGDSFICHRADHTAWGAGRTVYTAEIYYDVEDIKDFFGSDWLAMELYEGLKLDKPEAA